MMKFAILIGRIFNLKIHRHFPVLIPKSKTDQLSSGSTVVIAKADSAGDKAFATGPDDFMPETNLEDKTDDDVPITEDVNEQESDPNQYHMRGGINLIKRKRPKIIHSVRFNREKDPENFFREQLMLFTPWRKEDIDLQGDSQSFEERFEQLSDSILCNREPYEYHSEILDKALADIIVEQGDNIGDNVAPNSEHVNEQDRAIKEKPSELFSSFDPGKNKQHNQYDLLDDIGIFPRCLSIRLLYFAV
ncbi:predicted protein [Nematostella vectensis]|uniref:Uncharacterized protein n=1 Tax=Nematostella vectensis TaxID=45351 RepID=A7T781_NEMVE|nr:predicted protein [Nematostella vectensis]|eukprot:XP_001620271.1 hypothetical protein NEMVEDRAFT_v1g223280 [Nematostella vectensis]